MTDDDDQKAAIIARLAALAFPAGCRFAIRWVVEHVVHVRLDALCSPNAIGEALDDSIGRLTFDHVILGPGEGPPAGDGWTIYEDRGGIAFGRSRRSE